MKRTFIALLLGAVSVGALAQQGGFIAPNNAGTTSGGFKPGARFDHRRTG